MRVLVLSESRVGGCDADVRHEEKFVAHVPGVTMHNRNKRFAGGRRRPNGSISSASGACGFRYLLHLGEGIDVDPAREVLAVAKMLHAGEDFRFIARRIVIFASEDVGLADAEALPLAIATQQAVEFVGMPEARIPLAHAVCYMCRAKKNREAYEALGAATEEIEAEKTKRVPEKLKNKHFPVNPER